MTLVQNLTIQQGVTFDYIVEVVGGPTTLAGCTAEMQVRPFVSSDEVLLALTIGSGLTLDVPARQIIISVDEVITRVLSWNHEAYYDLELRDGTKEWRVMEGLVKLSREVTR